MAGRHRGAAEIARDVEEVAEFHPLVTANARDRRRAGEIGVGEIFHHARRKAVFIIEDVVGNAEPVGDGARVLDVLSGAAGAFLLNGQAVIVELERHADGVIAGMFHERRRHRAVDAA